MKKEVETLIGVPCSGKSSYLKSTYDKDEIFVISRDDVRYDVIKNTDFIYSDFFVKPKEGETKSKKYGHVTENGEWSKVQFINEAMNREFNRRIHMAESQLEHGKKVVVDLVNMTKKERDTIKDWFKDVEGIEHNAVVFDYENNLDLIKTQLEIRGEQEDKKIPFFVIEKIIENSDPIEMSEFKNIKFVDGLEGLKNDNRSIKQEKKLGIRNKIR